MARPRSIALAALAVALTFAMLAAAAHAADQIGPQFVPPPSRTVPPPGFRLSGRQAVAIADRVPAIAAARARNRELVGLPYIAAPGVWDVEYVPSAAYNRHLRVLPSGEVDLDGLNGAVLKVFVGRQAYDYLARGHTAHLADAPWVWVPLCVLFLLPFIDVRRRRRLVHLDLAALLGFGVSYWFLTRGATGGSVPLVYPVLIYLLVRMLVAGFRPRQRAERLVPHVPMAALAIGLLVLVAARIGINIANREVLDAGQAGVVGAYRMLHHLPMWGHSPGHADTYGPILYLAYVPFELLFPWRGHISGTLAGAHAAAIGFDLLTIAGLLALGTRLRAGRAGRELGLVLAYAWAAYPFTLVTLAVNEHDALIAGLLVWALVALTSPTGRGALLGLAGAAKFAPLALVPLIARGPGKRRNRALLLAGGSAVALFVLIVALYLPPARDGGLRTFWDATLGYQMTRASSFSLWVQHPGLAPLQLAFAAAAGLLSLAVAFFPRGRRDTAQVAALGAAVLLASQVPVRHWFYYYIVWFVPYVLVALFGQYETGPRAAGAEELEAADEITLSPASAGAPLGTG